MLVVSFTYANELDFAHIYADGLIRVFDEEIKSDNFKLSESDTYKKIIAARAYIESLGFHASRIHEKSLPEITDSMKYLVTVNIINSFSKKIFPSIAKKGNISGNKFPKNTWSLTFDDGPRGNKTKSIVDSLYKRGLKATFFMLTREAKKYYEMAKYVQDADMEIALHSYTHKSLATADSATLDYEITKAKIDLEELLSTNIKNFRLPYGAGLRNRLARKYIAKNELVHIFWNVDTLDWKDKNPNSVFERVKRLMKLSPNNSGVILFHDIQTPTMTTAPIVMDYLLENSFNVCTVQEVIDHTNGKVQNCIK